MKILDQIIRASLPLLLLIASSAHAGGASLCCPADFDGDAEVGGADLAVVLGAWGPGSAGAPADLDGSGQVDASDLAIVLGSWGPCPARCLKTLVVGSVQFPDGTPAPKAVVVTQLGGMGVSGANGSFSFEVDVQQQTSALNVTAVLSLGGVNYSGTKVVSPVELDGVTDAGVITVSGNTPCDPSWLPTFGGQPGVGGTVRALTVFDDGSGAGPALYVGGNFTTAGALAANRIAKWNGSSWSALGSGLNGEVRALAVFDDAGRGAAALYVGGSFTTAGGVTANRIARWNGSSWSPLGSGMSGGSFPNVDALMTFDDGAGGGSALYAGGGFTVAGGVTVNRIAKWDGSSWSALGSGVNSDVKALTTFDDGSGTGPALYAGGAFTIAGGVAANSVAKWNGSSWSALGSGMSGGLLPSVYALTTFDDGAGGGPALYAGGGFTVAGGVLANRIAKWNGGAWSALGFGLGGGGSPSVFTLSTYDDGSGAGPALYVGGNFTAAGGVTANSIAKWNGSSWSALGSGTNADVLAFSAFDDGSGVGPALYCGGVFTTAGGLVTNQVAKRVGSSWSALGSGLDSSVFCATTFDDGSGAGPALYVGGNFTSAGGTIVNRIARWDGSTWSALGSGVNGAVRGLAVFDDGSGNGPALYAGGDFTLANGAAANRIAKWNGSTWSPLGAGVSGGVLPAVYAVTAYGGGGGAPALYVGGTFTTAGGVAANLLAKWNGSSWSAVGSGLSGGTSPAVLAFTIFDSGSGGGPALYVGGDFTTAGGITVNRIARWNGLSWSKLGTGTDGAVRALASFDDGSGAGPALYAGGSFATAGGVTANRAAKWNGASWSALGSGLNASVHSLTTFDDGVNGAALYAGGDFTIAGDVSAARIARWDGSSWSSLAPGIGGSVYSLKTFDDGGGSGLALFVGGGFPISPAEDSFLAKWGCQP
ncbi:MAG: hypothetical protein U0572_00435 [Phycisphaerales bacterium]